VPVAVKSDLNVLIINEVLDFWLASQSRNLLPTYIFALVGNGSVCGGDTSAYTSTRPS
jgi:hypothetical protein